MQRPNEVKPSDGTLEGHGDGSVPEPAEPRGAAGRPPVQRTLADITQALKRGWAIVAGVVGAITVVVQFIQLWRGNSALVTLVFTVLGGAALLFSLAYVGWKRTPQATGTHAGVYLYPRSLRVGARLLLTVVVVVLLTTSALWARATFYPSPMTGKINIAIANFSEDASDISQTLSEEVGWSVRRLIPEPTVQFRRVPFVRDAEHAERMARQLNATILIWGRIEKTGSSTYVPRFTIVDPLEGGEVSIRLSTDLTTSVEQRQRLRSRIDIAVVFVTGLTYHFAGQDQEAVVQFNRALDLINTSGEGQGSTHGIEDVVYFYLGRSWAAQGDDPAALGAYQRALELNPDYSFAYIGIGNVYLKKAEASHAFEHDVLLDQALTAYMDAIRVNQRGTNLPSPDLYVEARAHVSMGHVYSRRGQHHKREGDAQAAHVALTKAEEAYRTALTKYAEAKQQGQIVPAEYFARAQYGLGVVYELQERFMDARRQFVSCKQEVESTTSIYGLCDERYALLTSRQSP